MKRAIAGIAGAAALFGGGGVALAAWTNATNTGGTLTAAVEFPPVTVTVPTVLGVAMTGQTLGIDNGTFNPSATSYTYSWLLCDSAGAGCSALGSDPTTALLGAATVGKTIRLRVTPKNGSTAGPAATSEPTQVGVAGIGGISPVLTSPAQGPAVTGTPTVGGTLTAADGSWLQLASSAPIARQWMRCDATGAGCTAIGSATGTTYVPVAADKSLRLRLRITATGLVPSATNTVLSLPTALIT